MFLNIDKISKKNIAAIDDTNKQITYGELHEFSKEFSCLVPERALIFCLCENNIGSLACYVATQSASVVPLLLGKSMDKELLEELISVYEPQYLWVPQDISKNFNYQVIFEKYDFVLMETGYNHYNLNDDLSLLLTTSGSTGSPKLVRHKYGNLESNAKNVAEGFSWTEKERALINLPMYYTMGLNVINTHLIKGAMIVLTNHNILSAQFWKILKSEKVTNFTGVPFSFEIFSKLGFERMELPHLTTLASGGGKLNETLFENYAQYAKKTGKRFFSTFGTTETSARMSFLTPEIALYKIGSIGKPFPGGEMCLLDNEGNEVTEENIEGELVFRGPNVTMGYAQSKEDLVLGDVWNGQYSTGDIAYRDKDGDYYIVGRISRFLKLSGHRVSLQHCEDIIKSKYQIECACTGTDKQMKIFITVDSIQEEVRKYISEKIGLHKSLFEINVIKSIPKNNFGKIMYKDLF